jgi:hypothetical protein
VEGASTSPVDTSEAFDLCWCRGKRGKFGQVGGDQVMNGCSTRFQIVDSEVAAPLVDIFKTEQRKRSLKRKVKNMIQACRFFMNRFLLSI